MNYTQITIPLKDAEQSGILIAQLTEMGFEGFEEEDAGGEGDPQPRLHAFIPEEKFIPSIVEAVLAGWQTSYSQTTLAARNWNEEWEKNFSPVIVDDFCAIRASFHLPVPGVRHEIVITPKMSFGTGHHATTYMMIEAMQHLDFSGRLVLDFGTGTGVLAILAEKLGAAAILAIDNDDWSIENARENCGENNTLAVSVEKMDAITSTGVYHVILANINRNVILPQLSTIGQHLSEQGVIVISGLLQDDFEDVMSEAARFDLTLTGQTEKLNWICLRLEKGKDKQKK
jgi:ribosomal protein L11 methyltransferase